SLQIVPGRIILIDLHARRLPGAAVDYLDNDGAVGLCIFRLIWWRWLRDERIQALRSQRRDHHEDDQQHQQNVNQGRHVDFATLTALTANCHSHKKSPRKLFRAASGWWTTGRSWCSGLLL